MSNMSAKLKLFCNKYDISYDFLDVILEDPKVIPMIRGKSFEFFAAEQLKSLVPKDFSISNPRSNSSIGNHDVDIEIKTQRGDIHSVECKLASKGGCKITDTLIEIKVKCMRSRTLGERAFDFYSRHWEISRTLIENHKDQYRPSDFEYILTSIGNSFYSTGNDGLYFWNPSTKESKFLSTIGVNNKADAYKKLYIAKSSDVSCRNTPRYCMRRKCAGGCGFIPNYPKIIFLPGNSKPESPWVEISDFDFSKI